MQELKYNTNFQQIILFVIKFLKILTKIYIFIKIYFRTIEIFAKKTLLFLKISKVFLKIEV